MKDSYIGSPTGAGNPPGQHSPSYLSEKTTQGGNFVTDKTYRGGMHIGINESATVVGNQPKSTSTGTLKMHEGGI